MFAVSSTYGARVRQTRKERGITQAQLAKQAGIGQQAISDIERGKQPTHAALYAINDILDIAMTDALTPGIEFDPYEEEIIINYFDQLK